MSAFSSRNSDEGLGTSSRIEDETPGEIDDCIFDRLVRIRRAGECQMNTQQKVIKNKVGLLKLAETPGSLSQACKVMGSRETVSKDAR